MAHRPTSIWIGRPTSPALDREGGRPAGAFVTAINSTAPASADLVGSIPAALDFWPSLRARGGNTSRDAPDQAGTATCRPRISTSPGIASAS